MHMENSQTIVMNSSFMSVQPALIINPNEPKPMARFESNIAESAWSPAKIMEREQLVKTIMWRVIDSPQQDLTAPLQIPYDLLVNPTTQLLFKTFSVYRCDFVITLTVTGTKFHAGLIAPFFTPLSVYSSAGFNVPFLLNHTTIEANGVNVARIRVPFVASRSYLSTFDSPGSFTLGNLNLRVITALVAGTGAAQEVPITITFHAENVEMYIPSTRPTNVFPNTVVVAGTMHSATSDDVVTKNADESTAPTIGGPTLTCSHTNAFDSPESVRDVLKRMTAVGSGDLVSPRALMDLGSPALPSDMSRSFLMGYMDAGSILQPNISMHPASYWASMYALGKGSLRYTFTFNMGGGFGTNSEVVSYGAIFLPGVHAPLTFSTPGNPSFDPRAQSLILPGSTYPAAPDDIKHVRDQLLQPLLDAYNFIPRKRLFDESANSVGQETSHWPQFYSNRTSGAAIVLGDMSHNSITMDIPFVCRDNAYHMPRYYAASMYQDGLSIAAVTNGAEVYDTTKDLSNFDTATAHGGQYSMGAQDASYGPHMSPGLIVFYTQLNTNSTQGATTIGGRRMNVNVYGALGDDFRFGVLRDQPLGGIMCVNPRSVYQYAGTDTYRGPLDVGLTLIPQFNAWGLHGTNFPSRDGTVGGQPHGNTITTINKFKRAANVTLPMNVTGDKFDTTANLSTMAMDKPSNTLGGMIVMPSLTSPFPNSTGIMNATRMALRADETFEASPDLFGTDEDEMDICYLTRKLNLLPPGCSTMNSTTQWTTGNPVGDRLFIVPLSPFFLTAQTTHSDTIYQSVPIVSSVASHFLYWSGSLRFRFKVMATQFHTGKLFFAINYTPFRDFIIDDPRNPFSRTCERQIAFDAPSTLEEALTQGGVYVDLSEETRDITVDIPYKSLHPRLDTGFGLQPHQKSSMGTLTCWVINPLVAPENVSPAVDYLTFIAGGPDFKLYTLSPFSAMWDGPRPYTSLMGVVPDLVP